MTDDERFEAFLRDAAADYQAPRGEVPRDDMWAAIQAQRGVAAATTPDAATPLAHETPSHATPSHAVRSRPVVRHWAWIGMAATLALGVLIGRYAMRTTPSRAVATVDAAPTTPANAGSDVTPVVAPTVAPARTANTLTAAPSVTNHGHAVAAAPRTSLYGVASARHLQAVQVLLASFTADPADARSDSLVSVWARGLLSNTRLLLDSPAARDPQRAKLLQDLEVILVQLVQRAPGGDAEARSAVERSIQKSQIIPRLRSALPASLQSGTE